jgi:hypothetical protein
LAELHSALSGSGQPALGDGPLGGQQFDFLATKVVPPRCPGLIDRPRLQAALSALSAKRLAVIKAPAGFGKTSLAVTWLQSLQKSRNAVAWLAIDSDDDEAPRFLFYMSLALHRACEGLSTAPNDLIREAFMISPHAIVSSLINELADVEDEVFLFLEDYHSVTNPAVHDGAQQELGVVATGIYQGDRFGDERRAWFRCAGGNPRSLRLPASSLRCSRSSFSSCFRFR